jgi:hypothetical protein
MHHLDVIDRSIAAAGFWNPGISPTMMSMDDNSDNFGRLILRNWSMSKILDVNANNLLTKLTTTTMQNQLMLRKKIDHDQIH